MTRSLVVVLSLGCAAFFLGTLHTQAQDAATESKKADAESSKIVIPIWPDVAPGSEEWKQQEVQYENADHKAMVRNVTRPTLTVFLPDSGKANGTAMIICPGGGFRFLSWDNEGTSVAEWLCQRGVTAFVLKYRLMDTGATEEEFRKSVEELFRSIAAREKANNTGAPPPMPEQARRVPSLATDDGRQAVKVVRERAAEWNLRPDRIGIMGFSAGAIVTMGAVMEHDEASRPNFAAPIYGGGTNGKPIPDDAPPLFILCANDDTFAAASSIRLHTDWSAAKRSVELHLYEKGGHGFGMAKRGMPIDHWIDRFGDWLASHDLMKASAEQKK